MYLVGMLDGCANGVSRCLNVLGGGERGRGLIMTVRELGGEVEVLWFLDVKVLWGM